MKPDFYERALRRIARMIPVVGLAGAAAVLARQGLRPALAFLAGAAISFLNFQALRSMANAMGSEKPKGPVVLVAGRYLLVAGAVYAIVKILGVALLPVMLGLLAAFGAVLLEILYELILYARA